MNFSLEAEHTSENLQKSIPASQLQTGTPLPPISTGPVQNTPADPVLSVPSQPNSFPEVPTVQFPPEGNASEEHQSFQVPYDSPQQPSSPGVPTNQDAKTSVGQTPRRQLPPHLRERWVFDPNYQPPKKIDVAPIVDWNMQPVGSQTYYPQYPHQVNPYYYNTNPSYSSPQYLHPGFYEQTSPQTNREQNVRTAASTFMQACLEVLNFNLSAASTGEGGITRTQ